MAFPTETVYGLGASAFDGEAVERLYEVKGRPPYQPLTVHLASREDIPLVAKEIPPLAYPLLEAFFPGPLTLVLPKKENIPPWITREEGVGVRCPNHPIALALIEQAGPLVAPSANISGAISPTDAKMVERQLGGRIDCIIDGGRTPLGVESTVLSLIGEPTILRLGAITKEEIETTIGREVKLVDRRARRELPFQLIVVEGEDPEAKRRKIKEILERMRSQRIGVVGTEDAVGELPFWVRRRIWKTPDVKVIARNFFSVLDRMRDVQILVMECPPREGLGSALRELLQSMASEWIMC